jgi:hypothetical protein
MQAGSGDDAGDWAREQVAWNAGSVLIWALTTWLSSLDRVARIAVLNYRGDWMPAYPPDFPCLFPLGFHRLSMDDVEQVCVDLFPLSSSRRPIMDGLAQFVQRVNAAKVAGEMWTDGSFLTEKIDPSDVDIIVRIDGDAVYDNGTVEQRDAIDWVVANQKATLKCDSYVLMEYPVGHPLHTEGQWWHAYWYKLWGFSREDDPKGIIVISLGGL